MLSAGFGKASIWNSIRTERRAATPIEAAAFCVSSGKTSALMIFTDMVNMRYSTAESVRNAVSRALKIPNSACAVFLTHTPAVPGDTPGNFNVALLSRACARAARLAFNGRKPAEIAFAGFEPKKPLNFTRRILYKDLGALTFYNGHRDAGGRPDISHTLKIELMSFCKGTPPVQQHGFDVSGPLKSAYRVPEPPVKVKSPYFLGKPVDGLMQGIFFREPGSKKPLGSLLRFAAHAAASNVKGADFYSGDFPYFARKEAERLFGGGSVFMTGPSGNLVPLLTRKSLKLAEKIGKQAARLIVLKAKNARWEKIDGPVKPVSLRAVFRFRDDFSSKAADRNREMRKIARKALAGAKTGMPLKDIKRLTDRYEMLGYSKTYFDKGGMAVTKNPGGKIPWDIFALRIGKYAILGLPGEPFGEYSVILRSRTIGRRLITVELCNGHLSYFPLKKDYPLGSYEVNAARCGPSNEKVLINSGLKALKKLGF